jgi:protein-S-isoprenylcysteine O-methyltransferase Ste14
MAPFPFSQTGARIALYVVLGTWVVSEWRVRLRSALNRRGTRLDQGSMLVVVAAVAGSVAGAFVLARNLHVAAIADWRWGFLVGGLALMCAGIALRQWAVVLLGQFFTVDVRVQPGQTVVDRGPYRWVRHPSYTGLIAVFVGLGLALDNWAALAVLAVVPTVGLLVRIRFEERALLDGLGEQYSRFAAGRRRLFPGVW